MQTPQIFFDDALHAAHLTNGVVSYIVQVVDGRYLVHRYFDPALRSWHGGGQPVYYKRGYNTCHDDCTVPNVSFDDFPFEYPARSRGISGFRPSRSRPAASATPSWTLCPGGPWTRSLPWKAYPPPLAPPVKLPPWKSTWPIPSPA